MDYNVSLKVLGLYTDGWETVLRGTTLKLVKCLYLVDLIIVFEWCVLF